MGTLECRRHAHLTREISDWQFYIGNWMLSLETFMWSNSYVLLSVCKAAAETDVHRIEKHFNSKASVFWAALKWMKIFCLLSVCFLVGMWPEQPLFLPTEKELTFLFYLFFCSMWWTATMSRTCPPSPLSLMDLNSHFLLLPMSPTYVILQFVLWVRGFWCPNLDYIN